MQLKRATCKNFKTDQQGYSQIAPMMLILDYCYIPCAKLADVEINLAIYKALHSLVPKHLSDSFARNSESHLRPVQETSTYVQLPMKTANHG